MHAGWSGRSQMNLKYEHWFGNESSQSLLEAYGVLPQGNQTREMLKPKQCPNCNDYMDLSAHNEEPLLILYFRRYNNTTKIKDSFASLVDVALFAKIP
jgi:hypothetical protein